MDTQQQELGGVLSQDKLLKNNVQTRIIWFIASWIVVLMIKTSFLDSARFVYLVLLLVICNIYKVSGPVLVPSNSTTLSRALADPLLRSRNVLFFPTWSV